jgi:hypothetical protein
MIANEPGRREFSGRVWTDHRVSKDGSRPAGLGSVIFGRAMAPDASLWEMCRCRTSGRCFTLNVNVWDFERSFNSYKMLGFRVVRDLGEGGNPKMARGLGTSQCRGRELKGRGVHLLSEPPMFRMSNCKEGFVCLTDPDGSVIELIRI